MIVAARYSLLTALILENEARAASRICYLCLSNRFLLRRRGGNRLISLIAHMNLVDKDAAAAV